MKKTILFSLLAILAIACNTTTNYVKVDTNYGSFTIELYDETPIHRDNFQKLVKEDFYQDLLFHRIIDEFMIQGGDPESKDAKPGQMLGGGGPGYRLDAELNASERCFHKKGVLAAAREGDQVNPEKKSSGSQFYIVVGRQFSKGELNKMERQKLSKARQRYFSLESIEYTDTFSILASQNKQNEIQKLQTEILERVDAKIEAEKHLYTMTDSQKEAYSEIGGTPHLDGSYTVFGEVVDGLDIIDKIAKAKTNKQDRPNKDIKMSMTFTKAPKK